MGIVVQLVLAVVIALPCYWVWLVLLALLGAGGDSLVYAALLDLISSLWIAHKLYWRHVRKHAAITTLQYPPHVRS
jgi:hypothetical protein